MDEKIKFPSNVVLIDAGNAHKYHIKLTAFKGFCDGLRNYTSEAKLKNFKYSAEELTEILKGKEVLVLVEKIFELTKEFNIIKKKSKHPLCSNLH